MRTTLYLVRHGKTDWNDQGRLQGAKDIPLNKAGLSEAKAAGITLKSVPVHAIYSSPLSRAHETAREIAKHHDLDITIVDALKETAFGIFEGITWNELLVHPLIKNGPKEHERFTATIGGAESIYETYVRASTAVDKIVSKHPNETVILVSHGLLMKTIAYHMGVVEKEDIEKLMVRNAYPYKVEYIHDKKKYVPTDFPIEWH